MKYLSESAELRHLALQWVAEHRLILGRHFFWRAGPPISSSLNGMIRSFLYPMLWQLRDEANDILIAMELNETLSRGSFARHDTASTKELLSASKSIKSWSGARFLAFVDGLDEFDGDVDDVMKAIAQLGPDFKVVVACRPLPRVMQNFAGRSGHLKLEHHSSGDIRQFVQFAISKAGASGYLSAAELDYISTDVVDRAQGVFILAQKLVEVITERIERRQSFEELALEDLLYGLHDFYDSWLDSIDSNYRTVVVSLLLITICIPASAEGLTNLVDPDFIGF